MRQIATFCVVVGFCLSLGCAGQGNGDGPGGFILPEFVLRATVDGEGAIARVEGEGTAEFSEGSFTAGTELTLTAISAEGWRFDHWEGDATGTEATTAVTMDSDKDVMAVFIQQFTLTVSADGEGSVEIENADGGAPFEGLFDTGSEVVLTPTPADGWWFQQWEGDATGTDPSITVTMDDNKGITAVFIAVAGQRVVTVDGVIGRLTIAVRGTTVKGVERYGDFAGDLDGTISGDQITLTSSSPGFQDSTISATIRPDGSWVGTINGSGFTNDPFVGDPVSFTGFDHDVAGLRTTEINLDGLLAVAVRDGIVRGTWRMFGSLGADVEGTADGNLISFTVMIPGLESGTVTATVQADGSWVGTIDGSGYNNEPFEAQPSFFP